jgi:hypothetical protein
VRLEIYSQPWIRSGELFDLHGGSFVLGRGSYAVALGARDEIQKDFGCMKGGKEFTGSNLIADPDRQDDATVAAAKLSAVAIAQR